MAEAATAEAPVIRPKLGRDDWILRGFMLVIGLYLVVALALPLYFMLSKSVATYSFRLDTFEIPVPSVARVLSVADNIRLELEFRMVPK